MIYDIDSHHSLPTKKYWSSDSVHLCFRPEENALPVKQTIVLKIILKLNHFAVSFYWWLLGIFSKIFCLMKHIGVKVRRFQPSLFNWPWSTDVFPVTAPWTSQDEYQHNMSLALFENVSIIYNRKVLISPRIINVRITRV